MRASCTHGKPGLEKKWSQYKEDIRKSGRDTSPKLQQDNAAGQKLEFSAERFHVGKAPFQAMGKITRASDNKVIID